jgi:hypothetical protein
MTNRATFWTVLAVVVFPAILLLGLFCVLLPGLNLLLVPAWSLVATAYVGGFSNESEAIRPGRAGSPTMPPTVGDSGGGASRAARGLRSGPGRWPPGPGRR